MVTCPICGSEDRATVHRLRQTCCCRACSDKYTRESKKHKSKEKRKIRAAQIKAVIDTGMTLSEACKHLGIHKSVGSTLNKEFGFYERSKLDLDCLECGGRFKSSPSQARQFCSYGCFIDSGGAQRAGEAAVIAMKKYGAKKDANHNDIFDTIRVFTAVHDLSAAGFGVPDGLAWVKTGWHLFDVKNPKTGYGRRGLNPRQKKWTKDWRGGPVFLIYTVDEAERFAKGYFDGLKRFPEDSVLGIMPTTNLTVIDTIS